jgi:hypothetical protein
VGWVLVEGVANFLLPFEKESQESKDTFASTITEQLRE